MGMAFAFGWTPCIGPVLGGVLGLAATRSTLASGLVLLVAYSLGLGVPFLATGLAFGRLTEVLARVRRRLGVVDMPWPGWRWWSSGCSCSPATCTGCPRLSADVLATSAWAA